MGFVEFLGFTKIFIDSYGRLSQVGPTSSAVFALVFDFASEGTILDHLSNILVPGQASQNWEIICDVLNGVSSGLRELHGHDVVHR
jgi:serine/threonine protein kinase